MNINEYPIVKRRFAALKAAKAQARSIERVRAKILAFPQKVGMNGLPELAQVISNLIRESAPLQPRPRKGQGYALTPACRAEIIELRRNGLGYQKIAYAVHCSMTTAYLTVKGYEAEHGAIKKPQSSLVESA